MADSEVKTAQMRSRLRQRYGASAPTSAAPEGVAHLTPTELVNAHAPLVRRLARRFVRSTGGAVDIDDLYSVGIIGLLQAQKTYDPGGGREFAVFAEFRVRGSMLDELRRRDPMSQSMRRKAKELNTAIRELTYRLRRTPTEPELAAELNLGLEALQDLRRDVQEQRAVVFEDNKITDLRSLMVRSNLPPAELRVGLIQGIKQLPERLQQIIALYYFEDMGLKQIGEILSITEARVCQLHKKAIDSLRHVFAS